MAPRHAKLDWNDRARPEARSAVRRAGCVTGLVQQRPVAPGTEFFVTVLVTTIPAAGALAANTK